MTVLFRLATICLVFVCLYHSLSQLNFHKIFFWDCNFLSIILYLDHFFNSSFLCFSPFLMFCTPSPIFLSFRVTFLVFVSVVLFFSCSFFDPLFVGQLQHIGFWITTTPPFPPPPPPLSLPPPPPSPLRL